MSTRKVQTAISKVMEFLQQWDRGNVSVRKRMLTTFIHENAGKTSPELELDFAQVASLFLARLTAWLRLTYTFGTSLGLQLKAVSVFLSASSSHHYLMEFVEVGGIQTLLEILGQKETRDVDKTEALRLLQIIASAGRKYKELLCECFGVKAIAECLAKSQTVDTQETASALLESLAQGNPKYKSQVYKGLIALLPCTSPRVQQLALRNLRLVQKAFKTAHPGIVEPLLNLLRSLHFEVQHEAIEFIRDLTDYKVKSVLLQGLVSLLKPRKGGSPKHKILEDPEMARMSEPLPVFVQQAAATRAIRSLSKESPELSKEFLNLNVVHYLLYAMGNRDYADVQREASLALESFVRSCPVVEEHVRKAMGDILFGLFMHNAEVLYMEMNEVQAGILISNTVNISNDLDDSPS